MLRHCQGVLNEKGQGVLNEKLNYRGNLIYHLTVYMQRKTTTFPFFLL